MIADPQLRPAPKPAHAITSPGFTLPAFTASLSARGMEPAEVLPYSARLVITFSIGMPSFLATVSMIRMLACGWRHKNEPEQLSRDGVKTLDKEGSRGIRCGRQSLGAQGRGRQSLGAQGRGRQSLGAQGRGRLDVLCARARW